MKKWLSLVLAAALALGVFGFSALADNYNEVAVYSAGAARFEGSGRIEGTGIVASGSVSGVNNPWAQALYVATGVSYDEAASPSNKNIVKPYTGSALSFPAVALNPFPGLTHFSGLAYEDGTKNLTVGWSAPEKANNYTITEDGYYNILTVRDNLTLNINAPAGTVRIIRARTIENRGSINITGGGKVVIFVDDGFITNGGRGSYNQAGSAANLALVFGRNRKVEFVDVTLNAQVVSAADISFKNTVLNGNVYALRNFEMNNSGQITGLVYAPYGDNALANSTSIIGVLYAKTVQITGSSFVRFGSYTPIGSDLEEIIGDVQGPVITDREPNPTATATEGASATPTGGTNPSPAPTQTIAPTPNPGGEMVTIKVAVARRMSIRLEDGTILKNGDTFVMPKLGTVRFQMCTNNWDTDTYTDDGQGLAGTKVFTFTHQANKELFLRTDNDRHFKFARFTFTKGDYQKLTGVDNVLSVPLESLSINFPLGTTVTVKAYVKGVVVETRDIFIDSNTDRVYWQH